MQRGFLAPQKKNPINDTASRGGDSEHEGQNPFVADCTSSCDTGVTQAVTKCGDPKTELVSEAEHCQGCIKL